MQFIRLTFVAFFKCARPSSVIFLQSARSTFVAFVSLLKISSVTQSPLSLIGILSLKPLPCFSMNRLKSFSVRISKTLLISESAYVDDKVSLLLCDKRHMLSRSLLSRYVAILRINSDDKLLKPMFAANESSGSFSNFLFFALGSPSLNSPASMSVLALFLPTDTMLVSVSNCMCSENS